MQESTCFCKNAPLWFQTLNHRNCPFYNVSILISYSRDKANSCSSFIDVHSYPRLNRRELSYLLVLVISFWHI